MIFRGLQKLSLIDYPGKVSAVVFVGNCNFRCPYCYNADLVLNSEKLPKIEEGEILDFLISRKEFLDGLVITGGEPTLNRELKDFIKKVKNLGFLVKLDTNGSLPCIIKDLIEENLIDYIAMDIKAPFGKYNKLAGVIVDLMKIKESIKIIKEGKIDYEFRTTVVPSLLNKRDIKKIAQELKGAKKYFLQNFFPTSTMIDQNLIKVRPYSKERLEEIRKEIEKYFEKVEIRT